MGGTKSGGCVYVQTRTDNLSIKGFIVTPRLAENYVSPVPIEIPQSLYFVNTIQFSPKTIIFNINKNNLPKFCEK